MKPLAATLLVVFALFHGVVTLPWLTQPRDPEATGDELVLRVPRWARAYWVLAAITVIVGAVVYVLDGWIGLAIAALGVAEICGMAIANGVWMHGRPTVSHHAIRIAIAAAILGLAAFAL